MYIYINQQSNRLKSMCDSKLEIAHNQMQSIQIAQSIRTNGHLNAMTLSSSKRHHIMHTHFH